MVTFLGYDDWTRFFALFDEGSLWLQVIFRQEFLLIKASEMANELREATLEFKEVNHVITQLVETIREPIPLPLHILKPQSPFIPTTLGNLAGLNKN